MTSLDYYEDGAAMKIACVQTLPKYRDIEANLLRMTEIVQKKEAELYIFPELALTGYLFDEPAQVEDLAQPIRAELSSAISSLAKDSGCAIITGFLESANGEFYNSSLAFDSDGNLAGHYRKVHLFHFEKLVFSPGDLGFPVFDLTLASGDIVRTGMMICYDWRFPEACRSLALGGAELVTVPSNIVTTTGLLHRVLQIRAFENKVIVAFADRVGNETLVRKTGPFHLDFRGESAIINFNSEILAIAGDSNEEIILAEIDPKASQNKTISELNDILGDRRPDQYRL